ncbi:NPCBM/NEW2 domain-containing protein [Micromonospora sp. CPCC 205546]|uniref:NPCBM/NEW2 domain-containing protein n=1 Tax=Micromonospora sp. CPCC 205546 TaxID=3122397 RepID=UPI002FF39175
MASTNHDNDPAWWKSGAFKGALAAGIITSLIAGVFTVVAAAVPLWPFAGESTDAQNGTVTQSPQASGSSDGSPVAPFTSPPAPTGEASASPSGSGSAEDAAVRYLADMEAVQGSSNVHVSKLYDGRVTREFNSSILASINMFRSKYTYVYTVDGDWKFFRATIGIDVGSKPGAEVHFRVYLNDVAVDSGYVLTMQETKELVIPVAGKSQIKLVTTAQKSGGVGNSGRATWGDARFTME